MVFRCCPTCSAHVGLSSWMPTAAPQWQCGIGSSMHCLAHPPLLAPFVAGPTLLRCNCEEMMAELNQHDVGACCRPPHTHHSPAALSGVKSMQTDFWLWGCSLPVVYDFIKKLSLTFESKIPIFSCVGEHGKRPLLAHSPLQYALNHTSLGKVPSGSCTTSDTHVWYHTAAILIPPYGMVTQAGGCWGHFSSQFYMQKLRWPHGLVSQVHCVDSDQ